MIAIDKIIPLIQHKILEMIQTLKFAKKTSKDDYMTYLRFILLGVGAIGGIGFVIKLINEFISYRPPS